MSNSTKIAGLSLAFLLGMGVMWQFDKGNVTAAQPEPSASAAALVAPASKVVNPGAVKVELFVMSQCPYGVQAEELFKPVVEKFGADIDFVVEFIGQVGPDGEPTSMHGPKEVKGDIVQACAMKYSAKWFDMVACQNKNWKAVDMNWMTCAAEAGLTADQISACADGPEGKELLLASFKRAEAKQVSGSPTIHIGGKSYEGNRRATDLMRAICAEYKGDKPAPCADIPEAKKVNVTLLTDKRCGEDCEVGGIVGKLKSVIAAPEIKVLDVGEDAGKALALAIKPTKLPAIVFDDTLEGDAEASQQLEQAITKVNGKSVIEAGEWNAACADEGGCKLDECKSTLGCRPEEPNKLEVFVMSQCPYGVKGLDAMKPVLENFKKHDDKLEFVVHFIGENQEGALSSMHGQPEVDEDLREICAAEHYGKDLKFMDYVWCRNKSIKDPSWESCTGGATGIDTAVLRKCSEGDEGKKLLGKSFAFSESLKIGASPTWLVNGKYQFSGIDPETIKKNVCAHNKLKGCGETLPGSAAPSNGGGAQPGCGE